MAGIMEASAQHPKPEEVLFSYGTAGVSYSDKKKAKQTLELTRRILHPVSNELVCISRRTELFRANKLV